jgi:hypothetical protein
MGGTAQVRRSRIAAIVKRHHPHSQRPKAETFRGESPGPTVVDTTAGNISRPALGALEDWFRHIGRRLANAQVQLQAHLTMRASRAIQKCLSAAMFVRWRGHGPDGLHSLMCLVIVVMNAISIDHRLAGRPLDPTTRSRDPHAPASTKSQRPDRAPQGRPPVPERSNGLRGGSRFAAMTPESQ